MNELYNKGCACLEQGDYKSAVEYLTSGKKLDDYIQASKSSAGRGGMQSKSSVATNTAAEGISVIIANGKRDDILVKLMNDRDNTPCTEFLC